MYEALRHNTCTHSEPILNQNTHRTNTEFFYFQFTGDLIPINNKQSSTYAIKSQAVSDIPNLKTQINIINQIIFLKLAQNFCFVQMKVSQVGHKRWGSHAAADRVTVCWSLHFIWTLMYRVIEKDGRDLKPV